MNLKEELLKEFFNIGGNHKADDGVTVEDKLYTYIESYGDDIQINDLLRLSNMAKIERETNNFEKAREIMSPTLKRLANLDNLDKWDFRILTASIGHVENFEDVQLIYENSFLKLLDKHYSNKPEYDNIIFAFSYNATGRLLRAKYFEMDNNEPTKKLIAMFELHFTILMDIFKVKENLLAKASTLIRKGIFYNDNAFVDGGFEMLKSSRGDEIYKLLKKELLDWHLCVSFEASKHYFNTTLGENIKNERQARNLTQEELAYILKIDPSTLSQIERGKKDIHAVVLFNISNVFGIPVEKLAGFEIPDFKSEEDLKIQQLLILFSNLTESEKKLIVIMIKEIVKLNPHRKDTPYEIIRS